MTGLLWKKCTILGLFIEGRHTARRSEHKWSGIWTDLCIDQTLMRAVKTQGGLIGRGMSDSVRNMWVLSMSNTAWIHQALQELTHTKSSHNDQHIELGKSRMNQDSKDRETFYRWFQQRNPFLTIGQSRVSIWVWAHPGTHVAVQQRINTESKQVSNIEGGCEWLLFSWYWG